MLFIFSDMWPIREKDAQLEALHALDTFEKLGAANGAEDCKGLLRQIEEAMGGKIPLDPDGEFSSDDAPSSHHC